ncbi:hypothetical protein [Tropicimonas sp. IMCC34043]|uniref:head-tail joining protein n=1 Tax=Tropicimonas sp. IMCC34043 TaxID=2248760 RepID=UPI000E21EFBB|nr:hypothetical protein [Tropicimonas sp. IMCC34043]
MIGTGDVGVFFDPADFGEIATAILEGLADPVEFVGIYSESHALALGVGTTAPVFTIDANPLAGRTPRPGEALTLVDHGAFTVAEAQPDGSGLIRLILERA